MTEITYEHISVQPFALVALEKLEITKEINEHGTLYLTGKVPQDSKDSYIDMAKFGTIVEVIQKKDEQTEVLFCGILSDISIEKVQDVYYLSLHAKTATYFMDTTLKSRSFQNLSMTYATLTQNIVSEYTKGDVLFMEQDTPLNYFTLQYRETDWAFLKRMASRYNQGLYPDFKHANAKFFFGVPNINNNAVLDEQVFSVKKNLGDYIYMSANYIGGITNIDFISFEIESYKQLELGEQVVFRDLNLFVKDVFMYLKNGVLVNRYDIVSRDGLKQKYFENQKIQGVSIAGNVIATQQDKVKVHIHEIDKSQDVGTACWFPYSAMYASEDGSGWYCMPEMGDDVRIELPNTNEGDAFAVSSVSKYVSDDPDPKMDRMGDPKVRYIRNPEGMEMTMTPQQVILTSGGAGTVVMDEAGNINIDAANQIVIKANKDIMLVAGDTIKVTATNNINMKCGMAEINLDNAGVTQIKGNEVYNN